MPNNPENLPARGPGRPPGARSGAGREALLEAAHEVMAERGYPYVTLREVAQRAGVKPALVNYYFGGKQGLLRAVIERVSEQVRTPLHDATTSDQGAEDAFRSLIHAAVATMMAAPYGPRLMVEQVLFGDQDVLDEYVENFARPNLEDIQELLRKGEARGDLRSIDAQFLMPVLFGACVFFFLSSPFQRRLFGYDEIDGEKADEFAEFVADLLLHGMAVPRENDS